MPWWKPDWLDKVSIMGDGAALAVHTTGHMSAVRCGGGPTETTKQSITKRVTGCFGQCLLSELKWTIFSRSCNHTDFLAAEFYPIHQSHHLGFPLI
jgi:hypothetical protein